jgi:hypothetical protein
MTLVRKPGLAPEEIIDATKAKVWSGMCSGQELFEINSEYWDLLQSSGLVLV